MFDGKELNFWMNAEIQEEERVLRENFRRLFTGFGVPDINVNLNPQEVALMIHYPPSTVLGRLPALRSFCARSIAPAFRHLISQAMLARLAFMLIHYQQIRVEYNNEAFYDRLNEACREEMLRPEREIPPERLDYRSDVPAEEDD